MKPFSYLTFVIASSLFGVILLPLLTYFLDEVDLGKYALINGVIQLSLIVPNYSVSMTVIRYFPKYKHAIEQFRNAIARQALGYFLVISTVINLGILAYSKFVNTFELIDNLIITLLFVSMMSFKIISSFIQSSESPSFFAKIGLLELLLRFGFTMCLLLFDLKYYAVFGAMLFSTIIASVISLMYHPVFRKSSNGSIVANDIVKDISKFGKPLVYAAFFMWILSTSDQYLLNYFMGEEETGLYVTGYLIPFQAITLFTTALMLEFEPKTAILCSDGKYSDNQKVFDDYFKSVLILDIPIIFMGSYFAFEIYQLIYRQPFWESAAIFPFIVCAGFLWSLYKAMYQNLLLRGKTLLITKILLVAACSNIICNFLAIPIYGILGAAIATVIAYLVLVIISFVVTRKYIDYNIDFKLIFLILTITSSIIATDYWLLKNLVNNQFSIIIRLIFAGVMYLACLLKSPYKSAIPFLNLK